MDENFAQQVRFTIKEKEVATMVVNGLTQQSRMIKYVAMTCPQCGCTIMEFSEGLTLVDIYQQLAPISPLKDFPKYCHECGTRIMCDKSIVGEQFNR